jgi:hypothetical protein
MHCKKNRDCWSHAVVCGGRVAICPVPLRMSEYAATLVGAAAEVALCSRKPLDPRRVSVGSDVDFGTVFFTA